MLTAKDITNKRFEQTKSGYRPEDVDDFLREIAGQIAKMQKEKEDDVKKIEVLVESVREYKKDEEALKDALIGAQKQGRAVIQEARENADKIIAEAHVKADEIIGNTRVQLEKEKHCLAKMQQQVSEFKSQLLAMYKAHLEQITSIPEYDDEPEEAVEEVPVQAAPQQSAPQPVQQEAVPQESMEATKVVDTNAIREKQAQAFQYAESTPTENRFGNLKFGQNK